MYNKSSHGPRYRGVSFRHNGSLPMSSTLVNAAGKQFVRDHLKHIPQPYEQASIAMRAWLQEQGHDLDPDQTDVVTLRYHGNHAVIDQRLSLTQALLSDWQGESEVLVGIFTGHWAGRFPQGALTIVDRLPDIGTLNGALTYSVFNGLFRRTTPQRYDSTTLLSVDVEAMQKYISHLNFHTLFVSQLDAYWQQGTHSHAQSLQLSYLAACNKQVAQGSLSEAGRQMAWQAAGVMERVDNLQVRPLNVYGYAATDLIYIKRPTQPQVLLYLPGNAAPFHEFDTLSAMQDWFAQQCRDSAKRQRLRQYFKMSDAPDGFNFSGLDTALQGLAAYPQRYERGYESGFTYDGYWPAGEYVNYKADHYSPVLEGDLFTAITERQREHSLDDAHFSITTNAQVSKARWRGYLVTTLNLVAPLALVVPELIPLLAVGGIAQLGLGIDQIVNGKTAQDTPDGLENIGFGLLNATPFAALAAERVRMFFPGKSSRFIVRVNDRLGHPLGPTRPPRLEDYFSPPAPPVPSNQIIRLPTSRLDGTRGILAALSADGAERQAAEVLYDPENDAFRLKSQANEVNPPYYQITDGTADLHPVNLSARQVDDQMREATLEKLGVELELPLDMPPEDDNSPALALKKQVLSLWVGNKEIPAHLLSNIAANARMLKQAGYDFKLYLTQTDKALFNTNRAALQTLIDDGVLDLRPLEDEQFFKTFIDSANHAQYQHALTGEGANFSSACDVLRYPMLFDEGGIYMDIDDEVVHVADTVPPFVKLSITDLHTPKEGLILGAPMDNELMNMQCHYNTNAIGSHAQNPLLTQISEEMEFRYAQNTTFYDSKPAKGEPAFEHYVQELSRMTGPGLLNDVIAEYMPRLEFLRKVIKLESIPMTVRGYFTEPLAADIKLARERDLALTTVIKPGNEHSWS